MVGTFKCMQCTATFTRERTSGPAPSYCSQTCISAAARWRAGVVSRSEAMRRRHAAGRPEREARELQRAIDRAARRDGKLNPEERSAKLTDYERNKWYILGEKLVRPCTDCAGVYPAAVMEFDHLPDTDKRFAVSNFKDRTLTTLRREIAKCELVCANCHRVRTARRGGWLI